MYIAFLLLAGLTAFAFVCLAIFHPLVCVVLCLTSKVKSTASKLVWTAVNLITGIFGSLVYTFVASDSPRLKSFTANTFKGGLLCGVLAAGVFAISPEVRMQTSMSGLATAGVEGSAGSLVGLDDTMEQLEASLAELDQLSAEMDDLQASAVEFLGNEGALEDVGKLTSTDSPFANSVTAEEWVGTAEIADASLVESQPIESPPAIAETNQAETTQTEETQAEATREEWDFLTGAFDDDGEREFESLVDSQADPLPASASRVDTPNPTKAATNVPSDPVSNTPSFDSSRGQPTSAPKPVTQVNRYTGETVNFGSRQTQSAILKDRKPLNRYLLEGNPALRSSRGYPGN
jgi:hypothetical protein